MSIEMTISMVQERIEEAVEDTLEELVKEVPDLIYIVECNVEILLQCAPSAKLNVEVRAKNLAEGTDIRTYFSKERIRSLVDCGISENVTKRSDCILDSLFVSLSGVHRLLLHKYVSDGYLSKQFEYDRRTSHICINKDQTRGAIFRYPTVADLIKHKREVIMKACDGIGEDSMQAIEVLLAKDNLSFAK